MKTKVKIVKQEKEIEGDIEEKAVTQFGTSAHIPVSKKHLGKYVDIVIPSEPKYHWVLSRSERLEVIKVCTKIVKQENGKLMKHKLQAIENIKAMKFSLNDLMKVAQILGKSDKHKHIVDKIKDLYNL